jgi:UDP-N-acetylmuramoyl-L-alanyl-D-glutamate--2,6-diaminopimelate ligase
MLEFRKFPDIRLEGKKLVWDSRQPESEAAEFVYTSEHVSADVTRRLLARSRRDGAPRAQRALGKDASRALGFPSRKLKIVGVTGTNGKTSSTHIMSYILAGLGHRVLQIGTLGLQVWEKSGEGAEIVFSAETGFTTPEAASLHDLFAQALAQGITHVVMEVSSHALALDRVSGVEFDAAVFTNLSQDHLDFHKTMEGYGAAKRLLFERELVESSKPRKCGVLGVPDEVSYANVVRGLEPGHGISFVEQRLGRDFSLASSRLEGIEVALASGTSFSSRLIGAHNAWNLTLSFRTLEFLETLAIEDFGRLLASYPGIPGRLERVGSHCFVDYAHTPDALEKSLSTLKAALGPGQKLVAVFGCGGDRDKTKRPLMGAIGARIADAVWITNDNPRTEDAQGILDMIVAGIDAKDKAKTRVIADRAEAIRAAVKDSAADDVVAVCGKGHEDYQIIGTKKIHFSDQECLRAALEEFADPRR